MTAAKYVQTRDFKTADGRDLSREEWRKIPGFPVYEVTEDGDVRNIRTGRLLKEIENKTTGVFFYSIRDEGGKVCNRSYQTLIDLAFGEPKRPEADWKVIPYFSGYQVTQDGEVRNINTKRIVASETLAKYKNEKTVRLRQDGINYRMKVQELIDQTWSTQTSERDAA